MKYKMLSESTVERLTIEVNEHLENGWRLYGNPFSQTCDGYAFACQAVVKDDTQEKMDRVSELLNKIYGT